MENKLEKIIEYAGNNHRYQAIVFVLSFLISALCSCVSAVLPFIQKMPTVNYYQNETLFVNKTLTYPICESADNFTIASHSGHSWITEWEVECDKFQVALMGSSSFLGVLIGSLGFQFAVEFLGRRLCVIVCNSLYILIQFSIIVSYSFNQILALLFFNNIFSTITSITAFLLVSEIVSSKKRAMYGGIINTSFPFCGIFIIVLLLVLHSWRKVFIIVNCLNIFVTILFYIFVNESLRYYYSTNDKHNFIQTILAIAKVNKKEKVLSENLSFDQPSENKTETNPLVYHDSNKINLHELFDQMHKPSNTIENKSTGILALLKYKSQRYTFLSMCLLWFTTASLYYIMAIGIKKMPGDMYMNGIGIYVLEIVVATGTSFAIDISYIGRKKALLGLIGFAILALQIQSIFHFDSFIKTILLLSSKLGAKGMFIIIYIYSSELYPTVIRSSGLSFNSVVARVGTLIIPFILEYFENYVNIIFITYLIVTFLLMTGVRETQGFALQDNIPEEIRK